MNQRECACELPPGHKTRGGFHEKPFDPREYAWRVLQQEHPELVAAFKAGQKSAFLIEQGGIIMESVQNMKGTMESYERCPDIKRRLERLRQDKQEREGLAKTIARVGSQPDGYYPDPYAP